MSQCIVVVYQYGGMDQLPKYKALNIFDSAKYDAPFCQDIVSEPNLAVSKVCQRLTFELARTPLPAPVQTGHEKEDALEYDMSEDLEDYLQLTVNSPPPSSKPQKGDKYKNR
ncbi:hypothetical protein AVEN_119205-1 [Araneus ventricosus]|uniref:Uncharacterized protein n=1 Tax=Araneus ventricosus TaxID=182803 RepID=A0A4Y2NXA8_ARAVE|nr:hypothetical protein AVEN_119205-1 [Araneus ventricosus]